MIGGSLFIMRYQLLSMYIPLKEVISNEIYKPLSMRPMLELEVKSMTSSLLFNSNTLGLSIVFHDQLLKVQKCSLVINFLSHLNLGLPVMGSVCFFAIVTLIVLDDEFNHNSLLNRCSSINLLLHCNLNLKSLWVGLRPEEGGINQLYSL